VATDCETLSEWPPKAAATASQHGNNAVLIQNITHANTNALRAKPRRPRGCLASDTPVILRVDENVLIKLHRRQKSLTAMRITTYTREKTPVLYGAAHSATRCRADSCFRHERRLCLAAEIALFLLEFVLPDLTPRVTFQTHA
jgi:hypothetical protein